MGGDAWRRDQEGASSRRPRYGRYLLPALAQCAGAHGGGKGHRDREHVATLSVGLGLRRRPHTPRHADRTHAGGFRRAVSRAKASRRYVGWVEHTKGASKDAL